MQLDNDLIQALANNGVAIVVLAFILLAIRSFTMFIAPIIQKRLENDLIMINATSEMLKEIVPVLKDIRMLCEVLVRNSESVEQREVNKQ